MSRQPIPLKLFRPINMSRGTSRPSDSLVGSADLTSLVRVLQGVSTTSCLSNVYGSRASPFELSNCPWHGELRLRMLTATDAIGHQYRKPRDELQNSSSLFKARCTWQSSPVAKGPTFTGTSLSVARRVIALHGMKPRTVAVVHKRYFLDNQLTKVK